MVSRFPCQLVSSTCPTPGTGSHSMVRPCITITPAAMSWPPSLTRASISNLSSRTPISQIRAAPESSARGSLESNTSPRLVR